MNALSKIVSLAVLLCAALSALSNAATQRLPIRPTDLVKKDAVWSGKLTQRGAYENVVGVPTTLDCNFKITEITSKDGDLPIKFKADLKETQGSLSLTYVVSGSVSIKQSGDNDDESTKDQNKKIFIIKFDSNSVKDIANTSTLSGKFHYEGTLTSDKIKGTWKIVPTDAMNTLEGDFDFTIAK